MPPDLIKCPYCPCIVATEGDFNAHIRAFGIDPAAHLAKYNQIHRKLEWGNYEDA